MTFKLSPGVFVQECDGSPREPQINYSDFKLLASYYMSLMEGDTHNINPAHKLLRKYGLIDEDGSYVEEDEEEVEEPSKIEPKKPKTDIG